MKRLSIWLWAVGLLSGVCSCRVLPIQMTRVTLSERFTQGFFDGSEPIPKLEMTKTVELLLGKSNYENLSNVADKPKLEQLQNKQCEAQGFININISLLPGTIYAKNNFNFFVSGNGQYAIVLKKDQLIYYTATFQLLEDIHSAVELQNGLVPIRFHQQFTGHLASQSQDFTTQAEVTAYLHIKTIRSGVYSVDYSVPHQIQVGDHFIGYLRFTAPILPQAKVIDLRGLRFVRNKY